MKTLHITCAVVRLGPARLWSGVVLTTAILFVAGSSILAQGGSPLQPEFVGAPVSAGPSVNEFTGDFTYGLPILTIPGPNGSSYSMTLSYRAGSNPNDEVSWVGYGWSLNAGAIIREKRGFADDWTGEVTYLNKMPPDFTVTKSFSAHAEFASIDALDGIGLGGGLSFAQRFSSRTGFGTTFSLSGGMTLYGQYGGAQFTNDNGEESFEPVLTPNLLGFVHSTLLPSGLKPVPISDDANQSFADISRNARNRSIAKMVGGGGINFLAPKEFSMSAPSTVPLEGDIDNFGFAADISFTSGVVTGLNFLYMGNTSVIGPQAKTVFDAYGYLHSHNASATALTDYGYEKDVTFTLKDDRLPVPFPNADNFHVTGGGSFRAYNRNPGDFRQNEVTSSIDISTFVPGYVGGLAWGRTIKFGRGAATYESGNWNGASFPTYQRFAGSGDEPWLFRFSGDGGGTLLHDWNDKAIAAEISGGANLIDQWGINDVDRQLVIPANVRLQNEAWERPGRNGYIGFTTNGEIDDTVKQKLYKGYTRDAELVDYAFRPDGSDDQIGEFALIGQGGSRYVYGLPVYARKEMSVQLGLENIKLNAPSTVDHNLYAYKHLDTASAKSVFGTVTEDSYATAWLLTEITTPDYIDLTGNGPSDDDLGGWTKFTYRRELGGNDDWKFWRNPFVGLGYDAGDLSDPKDDLGSFSQGEREQFYLEKIETKTHVAIFNVNLLYRRQDGYTTRMIHIDPAADATLAEGVMSYAMPTNPEVFQRTRRLDRITLYTKDENGEPDSLLSTVHFDYDYSLRLDMPNSLPDSTTPSIGTGMLTLRRVWTESQTVRNATINPFLFGYEYRKSLDYSAALRARYPTITGFADSLDPEDENPNYSPYDFDAWGMYRPGGTARLDKRSPYIPQNDTSDWDPAAWQLKWVRDPFGGELHIQYEQDEYSWLQDRPAMGMVSLIDSVGSGFGETSFDLNSSNKYYLRLSDIGVDSTDYEQVVRVKELIENEIERKERLLFRFLYALKGTAPSITAPDYNSDYISGYAEVSELAIDTLGGGSWYAIFVQLEGKDTGGSLHGHGVPKKVCLDYVRKQKRGLLSTDGGVTFSDDESVLDRLVTLFGGFNGDNHCKEIDYANSYIRIPLLDAKKGGGLRVKRLLSFDPAIEGDTTLFGSEYRYEQFDPLRNEVRSSGVAANEPAALRDENALLQFRQRNDDEEFEKGKVAAGRDRYRNEEPLGEMVLPGASVGYARVAVHPIHQGATVTGFSVTDFLTHRDYPYDSNYSSIGRAADVTALDLDEYRTSPLFSNLLIYKQNEHVLFASQGYRFVRTDLPGNVRSQRTVGGAYTPIDSTWITSASAEYEYFQPGDSVPLLYRFGDTLRYGYPGKVVEVVHATRRNGSYIDDIHLEGDVGWFFFSGAPYLAVNTSELSTHTTSKVIDYPAIVKGVTSFADGNYNFSENVAFDPRSGSTIITRSRDAFDGLVLDQSPGGHVGTYHSYGIPLGSAFPTLRAVAENERAFIDTIGGVVITKGSDGDGAYLDFVGGSENRWLRKLTPGDLVELRRIVGSTADAGRYHVESVDGTVVRLVPAFLHNWPGHASLAVTGRVTVRVLRSGRENAPGASLGGVTTYGETDPQVALGTNVTWSGGDASERLAFVAALNGLLTLGSGTIDDTDVDPDLMMRSYDNDDCGLLDTLGLSWDLDVAGDTVFVSSTGYVDTLVAQGAGGWFDLDDAGQVVFRSIGNLSALSHRRVNPLEQRLLTVTFCSDEPARRRVGHVIAASAGIIDDAVDYDGGGDSSAPDMTDENAYEKGEKGRWSPRTAWVYRTSTTQGSDPTTGDRIYADAGVFDDFTLFNWAESAASDLTKWVRLDSVTRINRHNLPYESVDPLGRTSTVLFDYDAHNSLLPVMIAWNAEAGTTLFESFESNSPTDFSGNMVVDTAHSGVHAYRPNDDFPFFIVANDHVLSKGLIVRFWMYPLSETSVNVSIHDGTAYVNYPLSAVDRRAIVGEWGLYEMALDNDTINVYYNEGDSIILAITKADPSDPVVIDDLKIQPTDAVAAASVYDRLTYLPLAGLDDQNFSASPVYDGMGRPYASVVETERGRRTVGDVSSHVASVPRDWVGEGSPFSGMELVGGGLSSGISIGDGEGKKGANVDIFSTSIGLTDRRVTVFGMEPSELKAMLEERFGELKELPAEKLRVVRRYEELNERYRHLKEQATSGAEAAREELTAELQAVEQEMKELYSQLETETPE